MNAERLHTLLLAIRADLEQTRIRDLIGALATALQNQVNQPNEASYQTTVASTRQEIREALAAAPSNDFPPSWRQAVEQMGIERLLGETLAADIEAQFTASAVTPAAILEWIQQRRASLEGLWEQVNAGLVALGYFEIGTEELAPGEFELNMLIPRDAVHEHLGELGYEMRELERILLPFVELATGSRPPLTVKTISSSDFGVALVLAPIVAATIAEGIDRIVNLYKTLLEVRLLRQQLRDTGVPGPALEGVEEHANTLMASGIDEAVRQLSAERGTDIEPGRLNELQIELKLSMNAIANRIDKGYNIEVRVQPLLDTNNPADHNGGPDSNGGDSSSAAELVRHIETVEARSAGMRFLNVSGAPILQLEEPSPPGSDTTGQT